MKIYIAVCLFLNLAAWAHHAPQSSNDKDSLGHVSNTHDKGKYRGSSFNIDSNPEIIKKPRELFLPKSLTNIAFGAVVGGTMGNTIAKWHSKVKNFELGEDRRRFQNSLMLEFQLERSQNKIKQANEDINTTNAYLARALSVKDKLQAILDIQNSRIKLI